MPGKLNCYDLGGGGVNLTKGPYHNADNEVLRSQNAELVLDRATGGEGVLAKRGGYLYLNEDALDGSIVGMAEVRFIAALEASGLLGVPISEAINSPFAGTTITAVGAATTWQASNADDAAYSRFDGNVAPELSVLRFRLTTPLTDPGIDTDHEMNIVLRSLGIEGTDYNLNIRLLGAGGAPTNNGFSGPFGITSSFTTINLPLTDVPQFRTETGYVECYIEFEVQGLTGGDMEFDIDYCELVIPPAP